jgi:hypothetical protein
MANELSKSASYVRTTTLPNGDRIGCLFIVEAALGNQHVIYHDDPSLVAAPQGTFSLFLRGQIALM